MTFFSKLFASAALCSLSISSPVFADATARYGELQGTPPAWAALRSFAGTMILRS